MQTNRLIIISHDRFGQRGYCQKVLIIVCISVCPAGAFIPSNCIGTIAFYICFIQGNRNNRLTEESNLLVLVVHIECWLAPCFGALASPLWGPSHIRAVAKVKT